MPRPSLQTDTPLWSGDGPRRRRILLRALRWTILGGALILVVGLIVEAVTWPDVATLRRQNPETTAFMERYRQGEIDAGRRPGVRYIWVPYSRISPNLKRAVLVAEDINFFSHKGFETDEISKAIRDAFRARRFPRGASTITQQLAKNMWLSPTRSPLRKLREALLTVQLESSLTKQRILELYLNVAQMGPGVFGAEAAARRYFDLPASALSRVQAAQLAASLSRPSHWNPASSSRGYRARVELILLRMDKATFLLRLI